jgi:hypothetical protein
MPPIDQRLTPCEPKSSQRYFAAAHLGRYWHKASFRGSAANGRFGGKADIGQRPDGQRKIITVSGATRGENDF